MPRTTKNISAEVKTIEKIWLSTQECATYLGVSKKHILALWHDGKIKGGRDGKLAYFSRASVDRYVQSLMM